MGRNFCIGLIKGKTMKQKILQTMFAVLVGAGAHAQINTGSTGSDGALDFSSITYTTNIVIDMHDHSNGIYQYTYVNIPSGVTVTFVPNADNTPVTWLVQSNALINGTVDVSGQIGQYATSIGGVGGPGGYRGGAGGIQTTSGQGPGGGMAGSIGGNASYASFGSTNFVGLPPGATYGNNFLFPLLGGSGGGGSYCDQCQNLGGAGGGGAILIVASTIDLNGSVLARGGSFPMNPSWGQQSGGGSGGAVRLVASVVKGIGGIDASGGSGGGKFIWGGDGSGGTGGTGRIRFDTLENDFGGSISGVFTTGFQPIIFQAVGQGAQLAVTSVGGVPVSASPTGVLSTPDAVLSAQQNNPIPVVVSCSNLPLNTQITVSVKPANGAAVSATGYNNTGTLSSSTATISIVMPRGGGLIYATAATSN